MKTLLFALITACAAIAEDAPFSGKWEIYNVIGGTSVDQVCTFTQTANEIGGTCDTQRGTVNVSGKVDQKKITFTYKTQSSEGGLVTVNYSGELNLKSGTTRVTGTMVVEELGMQGSFTANQSK